MARFQRQRRVTAAGQKGGAGKSIVATCLAYHGYEQGNRVLLVDADEQGSALTAALRMRLSRRDVSHLPKEVPTEGRALLVLAGMLLPAEQQLAVGWQDQDGDHTVPLAEFLEMFQPSLVIFDPPGRIDETHKAVLAAADVAVVVTSQGQVDRDALLGSADLIREVQAQKPGLQAHILLNKVKPGTRSAAAAELAAREAKLPLLRTRIQNRTAFEEAFSEDRRGLPPRGAAGRDIAALYEELKRL